MKRLLIALVGLLMVMGAAAPAGAQPKPPKEQVKEVSGTYSGAQSDTTFFNSCGAEGRPIGGRREFDGTMTASGLGKVTLSFDVTIGSSGASTNSWTFTRSGGTLSGSGQIEVTSQDPSRVHLVVTSASGSFARVIGGDLYTTPEALPDGLGCNTPLLTEPYTNTISGTLVRR